jgi:hypothetical protein
MIVSSGEITKRRAETSWDWHYISEFGADGIELYFRSIDERVPMMASDRPNFCINLQSRFTEWAISQKNGIFLDGVNDSSHPEIIIISMAAR